MIGVFAAVLSLTAWADWSVEGPAHATRADASAQLRAAREAGHKGRIVRRIADGKGWEYVVRFEGFDSQADAARVAEALAGGPYRIRDPDGETVSTVEESSPVPVPEPVPTEPPPNAEEPWYAASAEAHGPGLATLSDAERVKVVFVRTLADGRQARHVYARRGTDLYLSIEATEGSDGEVRDSVTRALSDKAWLVAGGETTSQDLQRARETVERFGPAALMPLVLDLERSVKEVPELGRLSSAGEGELEGEKVERFGAGGVEVAVGLKDRLVRSIRLDGVGREHRFDTYREAGGVQLPGRITLTRRDGEDPEVIVIESIELDGDLPEAWFEPPA